MKGILEDTIEKSFLYSKNNIVIEVDIDFIALTGFTNNELIGKTLTEISNMLRIDSQVYIENIEEEYSGYIFTKEYEPKEVNIYYENLNCENEKIYFFKENVDSRIKEHFDIFKQLYADGKTGFSIISTNDLILLKANENYLNYLNESYNKINDSIGKKLKELIIPYESSKIEEMWNSVITTGKPYYVEEFQHDFHKRGVTYWSLSIVPIFIEGKLKYIISTALDVTKRVLSRKLLKEEFKIIKEEKEYLESVVENITDGSFISNKDGEIIKVNSKLRNKYPHDTINCLKSIQKMRKYFDTSGNEITHENDPIIRALNGEKIKGEIIIIKSKYTEHVIQFTAIPIWDAKGNITMAAVFFNYITDSFNKEKIIKEQNDKLEIIVENMNDVLIIFDKDGNIEKINKAAKLYDFYSPEIIKMNDFYKKTKIYDTSGTLISDRNSIVKRIVEGEKISNYQCTALTNNCITYIEINGNAIYDNKGNFIAGILLIHNMSDRIQSEEALLLNTQYNLLNNILVNLNVGFVRYSYPDLKVIDMNNKAYSQIMQMQSNLKLESLSSLKGQDYSYIFFDDKEDKWNEMIQNLQDKKDKKDNTFSRYVNYTYNGEKIFLKIMYQPLFGVNNKICEIIAISIDITEEVKAKNNMEKTLKLQDEIFANISHELKTPLNVIFSTTQLMEFYSKSDLIQGNNKKVLKGVKIIKQNCYRFIKLINNITDISKIESGFLELNLSNENIVDITEEIVQSIADYIKAKELNIIFDTNIEEKIIACDPNKIERIMLNLISNAIKFTDANGIICVNLLDKGDTVEISVKDTGIGMDKKHLDSIFKRFHQVDKSLSRNAEGSGIGLYLVKLLVELHGGKISVESKSGEGSIFKVELPSRIIETHKVIEENKSIDSKIDVINIEFSDIYSI
ncbi:PAS domain-containing sensor histidine kinase [Clostridium beijerinckii]|nr:PAS domain-containing sensor histidine kinase [Clostridium beijerinckii]